MQKVSQPVASGREEVFLMFVKILDIKKGV